LKGLLAVAGRPDDVVPNPAKGHLDIEPGHEQMSEQSGRVRAVVSLPSSAAAPALAA
jgi:hypothetical protein